MMESRVTPGWAGSSQDDIESARDLLLEGTPEAIAHLFVMLAEIIVEVGLVAVVMSWQLGGRASTWQAGAAFL